MATFWQWDMGLNSQKYCLGNFTAPKYSVGAAISKKYLCRFGNAYNKGDARWILA